MKSLLLRHSPRFNALFFAASVAAFVSLDATLGFAQEKARRPTIYDEADVPEYVLPEPLVALDGTKIDSADAWRTKRRPEILELFEREVYGRVPVVAPEKIKFEKGKTDANALGGKATRQEFRLLLDAPNATPSADVVVFFPNDRKGPAPVFVLPNNQNDRTVERLIDRGYAFAACDVAAAVPDRADRYDEGVFPLFGERGSDATSVLGAWAWLLSRTLDGLETLPEIDASKAIVLGHSRLGKTALWAGAQDERFAAVVSNNSGCGGAALSRREFGETIAVMNEKFPHWSCDNFKKYGDAVASLPVDQHELIALIAPRPVYVAGGQDDRWADPKGEFLGALGADPVYRLLGTDGLDGVAEQPAVDVPVGATIRYHVRTGGHGVKDFDWEQYLDFADETVLKK